MPAIKGKIAELVPRTREHVRIFWERTQDEEIERLFPFRRGTLEEALKSYEESLEPDATSFGRVVLADGRYVGDVWCYGIDEVRERQAFVSIVIFDKSCWGRGIGTEALSLFCDIVFSRYKLDKLCAFAYRANVRSDRMLRRVGFQEIEEFEEDGVPSRYYELSRKDTSPSPPTRYP